LLRSNGPHWNGEIARAPDQLEKPLRWREPRGIFWGSMTDLFHESTMATEDGRRNIAACFGVMAVTRQHTHMVLTKRPALMREWFKWLERAAENYWLCKGSHGQAMTSDKIWRWLGHCVSEVIEADIWRDAIRKAKRSGGVGVSVWPLPNVWVGTTTEDQQRADERVPELLHVPAAVRFLSAEPLLGPVVIPEAFFRGPKAGPESIRGRRWVIAGGESGPGARPMHPDWPRAIRNQCRDAGVPFLFKQWGEYAPWITEAWFTHGGEEKHAHTWVARDGTVGACWIYDDDGTWSNWTGDPPSVTLVDPEDSSVEEVLDVAVMSKIGKGNSGRELDGRTWDEFPEVTTA
jgi:protein gp37